MLSIPEAISKRTSTRTFTQQQPPEGLLDELCAGSDTLTVLDQATLGEGRIGSYGIIRGKPRYVAVAGTDLFKGGMEGERLVIELTRRGLATCWISGTFNRSLADRAAGRDTVAVIAAGYAAPRASLVEKMMRSAVHARWRLPMTDIIIAGVEPPFLIDALEALRLAPSACNRQPWRLAFNPSGTIDVYGDPKDSLMLLDCGIALSHFLMLRPDYRITSNRNAHPELKPIATLTPDA